MRRVPSDPPARWRRAIGRDLRVRATTISGSDVADPLTLDEAAPHEVPQPVIDLGQVGDAQALEDVQDFDAVVLVVEDDVEDGPAKPHLFTKVIGVGVIQAPLALDPGARAAKSAETRSNWSMSLVR